MDAGRIAVVGMSMGGEEAIGAADRRIAAAVAEGATARIAADKAWLPDEYGWRGWVQCRLESLQYALTDLLSPADQPRSLASAARAAAPRPILMITGGEMPDERRAAEHIAAAAGNVSIWEVPGAGSHRWPGGGSRCVGAHGGGVPRRSASSAAARVTSAAGR